MAASSAGQLTQLALTVLYLVSLVPSLCVMRRRLFSMPRTLWSLSRSVDYLAQILLILLSIIGLASAIWHRNTDGRQLDGYVFSATLCGSFLSLLAAEYDLAPTARALYSFSCSVAWTLAYPLVTRAPAAIASIIPGLYMFGGIAILGRADERACHENGSGVIHPVTKPPTFLSRLILAWMNPLLKHAASNILLVANIWEVDQPLSVRQSLGEGGQSSMRASLGNQPIPKSFISLVTHRYGRTLFQSAVLSVIEVAMLTVQPFLIQALIKERKPSTIVFAVLVSVSQGLCSAHALLLVRKVGMRARSALTALVCDKGMSSPSSAAMAVDSSVLIEVDLFNVFNAIESVNTFWSLPLQIFVSLGAVIYILGWSSVLAACGCVLLTVPFMLISLYFMAKALQRVMAAKDARLSLVKDTLFRIKHIKLYGWESVFERKVDMARAAEMKAAGGLAFSTSSIIFWSNILPTILVSVSFATYLALGGSLTSTIVFPCLILFNSISRATTLVPKIIATYQSGKISYGRVREFLVATPNIGSDTTVFVDRQDESICQVSMENATFETPDNYSDAERLILQNCNINAAHGSLTVISGQVGSGKTTIVRAILGQVQPKSGSIQVSGRVAYAPQQPFLINGSIRDNILFGLPHDAPWYSRVVEAVCLRADFADFPDGDGTFLEGTSTALSGGQQSRVSLARAIYSRRPLVVLDDPLVAVDVNVQRSLVDNVLGPNGILKDCTRIVTTSSKALVPLADSLYTIVDGTIALSQTSLLVERREIINDEDDNRYTPNHNAAILNTESATPIEPRLAPQWALPTIIPLTMATGTHDIERGFELPVLSTASISATAALTDLGDAAVKLDTYKSYLRSGKRGGWALFFLLSIFCILFGIGAVLFLQQAGEEFDTVGHSSKLVYYIISSVAGALFSIPSVLVAFFACILPASRSIHARLMNGILRSRFSFFDSTPVGHILNRFTNDLNRVDSAVGGGFIILTMIGLVIILSLFAIVVTSPITAVYLLPVAFIYCVIQSYYMQACRQLRRLDNNARNPILNVASEMRSGSAVILAYEQADFFKSRARDLVDQHVRVWMPFLCLDVWLQLRIHMLASTVGAVTAGILLFLDAPSSTLGLVLNFVLQVTGLFGGLVQILAGLEADLISLERIYRYALNAPEDEGSSKSSQREGIEVAASTVTSATWPSDPSITMTNYNASYRPGGALCLRKINLSIAGGERVAIVGRTGAGKSSLVLALLRALDSGAVRPGSHITIGGRDVLSEVSIPELRKIISVIPQQPVVFSGTLQENLDPLGCKTKRELRDAVDKCNLASAWGMEEGVDPLQYRIVDGGRNLSTGQIQLLAVARAIAEKRSIVIIDEATASLDHDLAISINDTMRRAFHGCTVIAIAHHIETVVDYDRILVLDHGSVAEFDKPQVLLQNPESIFQQLARESKISH